SEFPRLLGRAERARVYEPPRTGLVRNAQEIVGSFNHDSPELLLLALTNGDEMDDCVGAGSSAREARRIGDVALGELTAPGAELRGLAGVAHETAHGQVAAPQRVTDMASPEAGAARHPDPRAV